MKKVLKLGLLLLAVACLFGVFAVSTTADDAPTASIKGHNLALQDNIYILYYVAFQNVPDGAETGVLVWTSVQESYAYGTETAKATYDGIQNGYSTYYFTGVSAKMMSQDIYAKAYIKDGDEVTYGKLDKYSVLQYALNKKDSTTLLGEGGTKTLGELMTGLLNYGAIAQEAFNYNTDRLANATYYEIKVVGGTLPDGTTKGLYQKGDSVTLTATNDSFNHWETEVREAVGTQRTLAVNVKATGTYTATSQLPIAYSTGLAFTSNGDGTCYVSGLGTCTDTDIVIPPVSPGKDRVTAVGKGQVNNKSTGLGWKTNITSVVLPLGVTGFGDQAFYNCTSLTSVTMQDGTPIPSGGTMSVGKSAFQGCTSLTNVTIPNGVTSIGESAFQNCSSLTSIEIPVGVTSIGQYAFSDCSQLASVTIPNGVTSIQRNTFENCSHLASVTLPDSLHSIGLYAFSYCVLTSIEIPDGVTEISSNAFQGCRFTSLEIPNGVTTIPSYLAGGDTFLTSITIPVSVTDINLRAFDGCSNLTSLIYAGTKAQWNAIRKSSGWATGAGSFNIYCTDGPIY